MRKVFGGVWRGYVCNGRCSHWNWTGDLVCVRKYSYSFDQSIKQYLKKKEKETILKVLMDRLNVDLERTTLDKKEKRGMLYRRGILCLGTEGLQKDLDTAEKDFLECIDLADDISDITIMSLNNLGFIQMERGNYTHALFYFYQTFEKLEQRPELRDIPLVAIEDILEGKEDAIPKFKKISLGSLKVKDAKDKEADMCTILNLFQIHFNRAKSHFLARDYLQAEEHFRKALLYTDANHDIIRTTLEHIALSMQYCKEHKRAIESLTMLLNYHKRYPSNSNATRFPSLFRRAVLYYKEGMIDQSLEDLNVIIQHCQMERIRVKALRNRAYIYFKNKNDTVKAIMDLSLSLQLDPLSIPSHTLRSEVYESYKKYTLAHNDLWNAINFIRMRGTDTKKYTNIFLSNLYLKAAQIYLKEFPTRQTYINAMNAINSALKYNPTSVDAIFMRASILSKQMKKQGKNQKEYAYDLLKDLTTLLECDLKPDIRADILFRRGVLYSKINQHENALIDLNQFGELNDEHDSKFLIPKARSELLTFRMSDFFNTTQQIIYHFVNNSLKKGNF